MDDKKYDSKYDGDTTDDILDYANAGKTEQVNEYVKNMKEQDSEGEPDTVQIFDTDGVPHKVSKTELLKKSTLALPALEDISSFVAVNAAGNAVGVMTKEQVASVLAELLALDRYLKQDKILGTSDDLNQCKFGIYSYFSENGLPVNTPSGAVRGIILCLCSSGQISQLILEYNNSIIFHRVSYNEGVNWGSWKQL